MFRGDMADEFGERRAGAHGDDRPVSGGIGGVEHGGYTVMDLSGAWQFGADDRHRIGVRLDNALDEANATSLGRAFADIGGGSYRYDNLGTPRTFHAWYEFSFR